MYQLIYISTATRLMVDGDVEAILAVSRRNNGRDGITGLLVHDGRRFLQALEGPQALVEATYARIRMDARHRAAVMLSARGTAGREFGRWEMASQQAAPVREATTLVETVDALVAQIADRNTRALFAGFARIDRAA